MDKLKNFISFIKENNDDELDNVIDSTMVNNMDVDDILLNMKNLPSEMWTPEMISTNKEFESQQEDDLEHIDDEIYDDDDDDGRMLHKPDSELSEKKSSEEQEYVLKDVFAEEEKENDKEEGDDYTIDNSSKETIN